MTDRSAPESLRLAQELVNTLDVGTGSDALAEFAGRHGAAGDSGGLEALRELRELLRAACAAHSGTPMPPGAAGRLEELLSRAPLVLSLGADGVPVLRPAGGPAGAAALAARVAAGIATAAADGSWRRLKACEAEDCRWVFYDRSPAGRGRWCAMAVCGSRTKMRAYRARRRRDSGRSRRPAAEEA